MARARSLKPGFFTNDKLAECQPLARLLFAGLWTLADREGRLEDRAKKIKAEVLPYDDADADELLTALAGHGFIQRYEVNGEKYIQIVAFLKHQNPHVKEPASSIPPPQKNGSRAVRKPEKNDSRRAVSITDSPFPIPDSITGLRPEVWSAWISHRGGKLSKQAISLQTSKLSELLRAGHDPNAVILQSIERGWSGLFPVKPDNGSGGSAKHEVRGKVAGGIWPGEVNGRNDDKTIDGTAERVA